MPGLQQALEEEEEEEEEGMKEVKDVGSVSAWRNRPPGKNESEGSGCLINCDIVVVRYVVLYEVQGLGLHEKDLCFFSFFFSVFFTSWFGSLI